MYKSKLQELCQRRSWGLPEYNTTRDGPAHMPRFTATVSVREQVFQTPTNCKSSKDAQNTAARIAFENFSGPSPPSRVQTIPPPSASAPDAPAAIASQSQAVSPVASVNPISPSREMVTVSQDRPVPESPLPSSLPLPTLGLLPPKNDANSKVVNAEVLPQSSDGTKGTSTVYKMAIGSHDKSYKETLPMYKNRLQHYAQKQNLGFPVYGCEAEGPPHARRFKSRVTLNGKSYETLEFFTTLKEAEQAAAKVACQELSVDGIQEDAGLFKNLLQEFAQKKGLVCPSYETISSGMSHMPVFVSTVEIGSYSFRGAEARTKKQAEMNAAKVAYCNLTESCPVTESSRLSTSAAIGNLAQNIQPMATPKKHQGEDEEAPIQAKKAKTSTENVNMNASLPGSSNPPSHRSDLVSSQIGNPSSAEPVVEQSVMVQPPGFQGTIVMPPNSSLPRPEGAEIMAYSDDKWMAYKVGPTKGTTA